MPPPERGTPVVLFVCEHGAAKSVLAATWFARRAREAGLPMRALSRGTDPDVELPPSVVAGLGAAGLAPCTGKPEALRDDDLRAAAQLVTFDLPALAARAPAGLPRAEWNGLPPVSAEFAVAFAAIRAKVDALVDSLRASGKEVPGR